MNFEHAPLKTSFWKFILPSVIAQWIFALYTMVDGMFVAKGVGETALSAINIAMPFVNMLFSISILFAVGTSTVIAISLGQRNNEEANRAYTQNLVCLLIISLFAMVLVYLNIDKFCYFLGSTSSTFTYVKQYILSVLPFSWCFILSYSFEILVKTDGYPRFATLAVTSGAIINCVLDYVFVFIFNWGITGAGVATGISQLILIIIYLSHFFGKKTSIHFVRKSFQFTRFTRVFKIGLSSGITELSAGIITFLFNHMILKHIGDDGIISYTIIAYINTIVTMSMIGISQGVQPLISFFYGKCDMSACKKLLRYSATLTITTGATAFILTNLGADIIVMWFIDSELVELTKLSIEALRTFCISFLLLGFNVLASGFFTSVEQPQSSLLISTCRGLVSIAFSLQISVLIIGSGGIWWAQTISELICIILTIVLLKRYYNSSNLFFT